MKKLTAFITALMLSGAASAATFLAVPEDGVKILVDTKEVCSEKSAAEVVKLNPPKELKWIAASVEVKGDKFAACAAESEGRILLVYEDGDVGVVPVNMFHLVRET